MATDPDKIEHMRMIQAVIARLAGNCFLIKAWGVTLATGVLAFAASAKVWVSAALGILPLLVLWGLDGYYLWQEKLFRRLFDAVRADTHSIPPFSLNTEPVLMQTESWVKTTFSKTIIAVYLPLTLMIAGVSIADTWGYWTQREHTIRQNAETPHGKEVRDSRSSITVPNGEALEQRLDEHLTEDSSADRANSDVNATTM